MANYRYSHRAEADLYDIGIYTLRPRGEAQTRLYLLEINNCCQLLADNPGLGRLYGDIRPGLRRMEEGKHVVFYRDEPGGIVVCRVLHQRMLSETQELDADD